MDVVFQGVSSLLDKLLLLFSSDGMGVVDLVGDSS